MSVELLHRKFTVKEYHKIADAGVFAENDRLELIRGEIVEMSPIGIRHATCIRRLNAIFSARFGDRLFVDIQNPVELAETSQPQPDVALLKPREDFYESGHPQPEDIFLLVEVADTTVKYDREVKVPLYAEVGVMEVWLVDINGESVEVYREPSADGYQNVRQLRKGEMLSVQAFSEEAIAVSDILGK